MDSSSDNSSTIVMSRPSSRHCKLANTPRDDRVNSFGHYFNHLTNMIIGDQLNVMLGEMVKKFGPCKINEDSIHGARSHAAKTKCFIIGANCVDYMLNSDERDDYIDWMPTFYSREDDYYSIVYVNVRNSQADIPNMCQNYIVANFHMGELNTMSEWRGRYAVSAHTFRILSNGANVRIRSAVSKDEIVAQNSATYRSAY